jgi:hypothetical protein
VEKRITYVGLDVHKDTIAVALAERANGAKCVSMARSPTPHLQLVSKLARGGHRLRFCYEAGPCGYGIQRTEMAARSAAHEHHLVVEACRVCSPRLPTRKFGRSDGWFKNLLLLGDKKRPVRAGCLRLNLIDSYEATACTRCSPN